MLWGHVLGDEDFAPTQRIILFVCVKQGALRRVFVRVFVFAVLSASPFFRIKNLNTITPIITCYTLFLTHLILHLITLNDANCKSTDVPKFWLWLSFCLQYTIRQEEAHTLHELWGIDSSQIPVIWVLSVLVYIWWTRQCSSFQLKKYLSIVCLLPQLSPNFSLLSGQKAI